MAEEKPSSGGTLKKIYYCSCLLYLLVGLALTGLNYYRKFFRAKCYR